LIAVAVAQADAAVEAQLAKTLFQQGKVEEAIPHFEKVTQLREKDPTAWYNLAYANRKAGRFEQAAQAYLRFTQLAPEDADGYFGLAESLRQSGKTDDAIKAFATYIQKEKRPSEQKWIEAAKQRIAELQKKGDASAALAKGDAAFAAKDYRAALFAYQDATLADPKSVAALLKSGQAYAKLGHDAEAIEQWNRALQLDPNNAEARAALNEARERQAQLAPPPAPPKPAVVVMEKPPEKAPEKPPEKPAPPPPGDAKSHYVAGVNLINQRRYEESLAELDQALQLDPGMAVARVARGSSYIALSKYDAAVKDYAAAHEADPALAAPLFGLAEAYRGLGDNTKAADFYRQFAASTAPDATQALKDYALQNAQSLSAR